MAGQRPRLTVASRLINVLFGVDETVNAALGGSPRETISGTVGRAAAAGAWWALRIAQPLVNLIMRNPLHCQEAVAAEARLRAADPEAIRPTA